MASPRALTLGADRHTLRSVKLTSVSVWLALVTLPGCGTSDAKNAPSSGGANQGVSGASTETGGSNASEAGSATSAAGHANAGEGGGPGTSGGTSGGSSNQSGAGGTGVPSGGIGDAPPEVEDNIPTADLTDGDKAALCDWQAKVLGGYGHVSQCGMGTRTFFADQATCVANAFKAFCAKATAGQFVDCVTSTIASNGCNNTDECRRLYCM